MIEVSWRYDAAAAPADVQPTSPSAAITRLREGNAAFAGLGASPDSDARRVVPISLEDLGIGAVAGQPLAQAPFAAILSCADARVPVELVLMQAANDLFVVRVAGNVPGGECIGSLDYAIAHLPSVRLIAVVGHTGCGAVAAAVDAYLQPGGYLGVSANLPLRGIVDALVATVHGAAEALRAERGSNVAGAAGYRAALIDTAVTLNAAVTADSLARIFAPHLSDTLGVGFGVYDLASRTVGLPATDTWVRGITAPPDNIAAFAGELARSAHVAGLLAAPGAAGH